MDSSITDKLLFLRLISDICPNYPSLGVCSNLSEEDYVIMKPHDFIIHNVIDDRTVGVGIISGKGGSGKTYGIGYYLYYKHFSRGFNKNNAVIYSVLSREDSKPRLEVKLSKVDMKERVVSDLRDFFHYLTSLKGEYGIRLVTHLVIDNVNDTDSIEEIIKAYRETVTFYNGKPLLKLYILTRVSRKLLAEELKGMGLKSYSLNAKNRYQKENLTLCKFFDDDKYKISLCKMSYDHFSYSDFLYNLMEKLTSDLTFLSYVYGLLYKSSILVGSLNIMSHILPSLITERLRNMAVNLIGANFKEIAGEFISLIDDYPYTYAIQSGYILPYVKYRNLYTLSKRILKLFLKKFPESKKLKGPINVAINQSYRIPLTFVLIGKNLYSLAYVQSKDDISHAVERASQFVSDLMKEESFKDINSNLILMFPRKLAWLEKEVKAGKSDGINVIGLPLSKKDMFFLIRGLVHYS